MWDVAACGEAGLCGIFLWYVVRNDGYKGVVYLVIGFLGVDYDSSFEAELLSSTQHCKVWAYDPTSKSFGSRISRALSHRTHFASYGLSPSNKNDRSGKRPRYTLDTLMKMNGESFFLPAHADDGVSEFFFLFSLASPET